MLYATLVFLCLQSYDKYNTPIGYYTSSKFHYSSRGITTDQYDEYVTDLESRQQELNDRLKMLTSDNKSFQLNASYLLDLAQRAEELFKASDEALQNKLLEYVLSNIELKDKKLSYVLNDPFKTIVETKKKALSGSNSDIWCG